MKATLTVVIAALVLSAAAGEVYLDEKFEGDWESRWVQSSWKGRDQGKFVHTAGKYYLDPNDKGIQTSEDNRWYTTSTEFPEFSNEGKTLVIQYSVKFEEKHDCGGAYLKILPKGIDQKSFNGDTQYNIMFGPDICGYSTSKVHAIFNYNGKNLDKKDEIKLSYSDKDSFTHFYTLIVRPDNTYEVLIDGKERASGKLEDDWDFLPPKEIDDPEDKKPADWVDEAEIDDPEDKKPEGYDDIPSEIPDPDASKPEDWDDESDGEWEAPMIPNPEYKGPWKPRKIPNPKYKGVWTPRRIPNPDYKEDKELYKYDSFAYVGIEIWQVNHGTLFDNILITDDVEVAKAAYSKGEAIRAAEKKMKDAEEAAKKAETEEDEEEDDDDEEESVHDEL